MSLKTSLHLIHSRHQTSPSPCTLSTALARSTSAMVGNDLYIHSVSCYLSASVYLVELSNQNGELLDNMTVLFETEDTCFCYDQCGCVVS